MVKIAGVEIKNTQLGEFAKSPLIGNVDGKQTPLVKVLGDKVIMSQVIDLSGGAIAGVPIFATDSAYTLVEANAIYTEGSSADAGVNISVGDLTGTQKIVKNVATIPSKSSGSVQELEIENADIGAYSVINVSCAGGKTGNGEVVIQLVLQKA